MSRVYYILIALIVLCVSCVSVESDVTSGQGEVLPVREGGTPQQDQMVATVGLSSSGTTSITELGMNEETDGPRPHWVDGDFSAIGVDYPDFFLAFGTASYGSMRASSQAAESRARASLATFAKSEIERELYADLDESDAIVVLRTRQRYESDLSREIDAGVRDATIIDTWVSEDGEVFILIGHDFSDVISSFRQQVQSASGQNIGV